MRAPTEAALCAKAIRELLKKQFPGKAFRVTSQNYSGGNSVDVSYVGQYPPIREVEKVVSPFKDGDFNGMEDIYEYRKPNGLPRAKFVSVTRRTDPKDRETIIAKYSLIDDQDTQKRFSCYLDQFIWQTDCRESSEASK